MAMVGWNLFKHPEEGKGETFVGNTKLSEWPNQKYATLKTARLGVDAFDIEGNLLDLKEGMRPLFIGNSEHAKYEAIMMGGRR